MSNPDRLVTFYRYLAPFILPQSILKRQAPEIIAKELHLYCIRFMLIDVFEAPRVLNRLVYFLTGHMARLYLWGRCLRMSGLKPPRSRRDLSHVVSFTFYLNSRIRWSSCVSSVPGNGAGSLLLLRRFTAFELGLNDRFVPFFFLLNRCMNQGSYWCNGPRELLITQQARYWRITDAESKSVMPWASGVLVFSSSDEGGIMKHGSLPWIAEFSFIEETRVCIVPATDRPRPSGPTVQRILHYTWLP
jgi:hypothetical protein